MDRKEFLTAAAKIGCMGACGLFWSGTASGAAQEQPGAPDVFVGKTHQFVADMMRALDGEVDQGTRERIMARCGRACFAESDEKAGGFSKRFAGKLDELVAVLEKEAPGQCRREGDTIHFKYGGDGKGKGAERHACLCPIVQKAAPGLSGTFCLCSVGYVSELFERAAGHPVRVVLLESLKRGGNACRFRIEV